jgi:hypothetical protein
MLRRIFGEEKNFSMKSGTGIGMKASEWKNGLIKDHIAGNKTLPVEISRHL